jgi:hypothetical protein
MTAYLMKKRIEKTTVYFVLRTRMDENTNMTVTRVLNKAWKSRSHAVRARDFINKWEGRNDGKMIENFIFLPWDKKEIHVEFGDDGISCIVLAPTQSTEKIKHIPIEIRMKVVDNE